MSAKHTPGPWELIGKQGTAVWAGDKIIAQMPRARIDHRQSRIDARLIAAAPELLEALRRIVDCFEIESGMVTDGHIQAACAAIAKATGEAE